ncbi:MAG TPA: hypothetical protein PK530_21510, partial [Anaerolineales bacterium]|nr:hypothetical protein [Anaerolineales bacterium]
PQRAIGYYLWKADELIKQRSRDRYAEAAGYLQRVKRLSGDTGQMDAWANTIRAIRENNKKLPALQDELKKAGL